MSRKQYGVMLQYIASKYQVPYLDLIAQEFYRLEHLWSSIMGLMLKSFVMNNDDKLFKKCETKMKKIAEKEMVAYDYLLQVINNEHINKKSIRDDIRLDEKKSYSYAYVDIQKYVNNDGAST